jgi:hypothetical protein
MYDNSAPCVVYAKYDDLIVIATFFMEAGPAMALNKNIKEALTVSLQEMRSVLPYF